MEKNTGVLFSPTPLLRWVVREVPTEVLGIAKYENILQQLWRDNYGNEKWEDVPTVIV